MKRRWGLLQSNLRSKPFDLEDETVKIAIGADSSGLQLKEEIKKHLAGGRHQFLDLGASADQDRAYYEVAHDLASRVAKGEFERGILVCGTGMGMAIIANKHPGVYAAVCEDASTAAKARSINNANMLTLGGMFTTSFKAKEIIDAFLSTEFKSGWDMEEQKFLDKSMAEIGKMESRQFISKRK